MLEGEVDLMMEKVLRQLIREPNLAFKVISEYSPSGQESGVATAHF